ncbi:UbiA family prenyltransferase [Oceaniglobus indicus]|uniref:UbiA family prenyltransferase n=1 Tax=Oceaniglobus indicus TaxID=2047749 RepID=UPI000C1A7955|nr:UbiA family prenyltransferase [Oceaniglobus indicus]
MDEPRPLILRAEGALLRTRPALEIFWAGLGQAPLATLGLLARHPMNPAAIQAGLGDRITLRADLIPLNSQVAALVDGAHSRGQPTILVSDAPTAIVTQVAKAHGITDTMSTADPAALAYALAADYGAGNYDLVSANRADLPALRMAHTAYFIGRTGDSLRADDPRQTIRTLPADHDRAAIIKALRPHQWVKNVLLFLPMIAAHDFTLSTLLTVLVGIAAFSAAASSIYVVNDLLDLDADRLHATKCNRPFAAGRVPLGTGMGAGLAMAAIAIGLGAALGAAFLAVIVVYMVLSLAYSLRLKRMRWVDIFCLAALYTLRVVAGAAAGRVDVSIYMLVFIFPIFVTLGCVKRMTELALAKDDNRLPGRGYGRSDLPDLLNMAGVGMVGALTIFTLYALSDQGRTLYPTTWILLLALVPLAAWLIRMIALGYSGRQDYDPIVFALRDRLGVGLLLITLSLMFWAAGLWSEWFG